MNVALVTLAAMASAALGCAASAVRVPARPQPGEAPAAIGRKVEGRRVEEQPAPPPEESAPASRAVPTTCSSSDDRGCVMEASFAAELCKSSHPDIALALFRKGTPWLRAYVTRQVEAWSTAGFARTSAMLETDEEVLVVSRRAGSGMIVGGGSLDVLRWDGTCVSLMADEVSFSSPRHAGHARIPWTRLDDGLRHALTADDKIRAVDSLWRKECARSRLGARSPECARVDERLSGGVVSYVRRGGQVPDPEALRD